MFNGKKLFEYITSFSKIITIAWLCIWVETILFTQIATIFNWGDACSIQYINDNVVQIGLVVCGFYFCTKTVENVAQGIESYFVDKRKLLTEEKITDISQIEEFYQGE